MNMLAVIKHGMVALCARLRWNPTPDMSSRDRLVLVLSLSMAGSAATALYLLVDGTSPRVAKARANEYLKTIRHRLEGVPVPADAAVATSRSSAAPIEELHAQNRSKQTAIPRRPEPTDRETTIHPASYAECHTCSGPRLWFFAEKLGITRLKRRFTPDPESN
jgi:hypothetical protein